MAFSKAAIIGSTGLVGIELLTILEERAYPLDEIRLFASGRSEGKEQLFRATPVEVRSAERMDLKGLDVAFFMAGADTSRKYVPLARADGVLAIDNSSAFRREADVPLVVPEVNPRAADSHDGLISNPNCTTIQLVAAINPIHQLSRVRRLVVSTYQSISGAGRDSWDELLTETEKSLRGESSEIAFNLQAGIDRLLEDGHYYEEEKVVEETRKILDEKDLAVSVTTVRVPVLRAHSVSVYLETEEPLALSDVEFVLSGAPGLRFVKDGSDLRSVSPAVVGGEDEVWVGRLRKDRSIDNGMLLWVVADNLRKGAALNAVQIAELIFGTT